MLFGKERHLRAVDAAQVRDVGAGEAWRHLERVGLRYGIAYLAQNVRSTLRHVDELRHGDLTRSFHVVSLFVVVVFCIWSINQSNAEVRRDNTVNATKKETLSEIFVQRWNTQR
jgi:hypothetical protein